MKIKPIKLDKEKFKGAIIKEDTEFRECKNADGTLLGIFPKSYNYTITLPDEVPEFQWIKIGNKWCKTEKEPFARNLTDEETDIYNSWLEAEAETIDEISLL